MMSDSESREARQATSEAILANAVDAIITIDDGARVQYVNPAAERLFGYAANQLIGENVKLLMPSPYREEHDEYIQSYLRSGHRKIIGIGREVVGRRSDGSTFPMHLAVSEARVGSRRLFTGIVRDLTDIKQAEAVQASLGKIVEESLNELYFFDAETLQFIQVNRGARNNLGYSMDELRSMTPIHIKPEHSAEEFAEMTEPLLSGQSDKIVWETCHQRKNGTRYDVEVHLQMGWLHDKRVFVAIVLDITTRKAAERQLNQMNEDLERRVRERTRELRAAQSELVKKERMAMLGQVSGGIAHEIRNPLNAIKTSAYFLLRAEAPPAEKRREHLNRIDRQVTMIDNVVTALADVAKLPEPRLSPTDVREVLRGVLASVNLPAHIEVTTEFAADLPHVHVDENQIPIVFRNLVRNARDAMQEGGVLIVSAFTMPKHVCVAIKDNGVGIPEPHLDRVFEPLFSTKARGMGLGLAITKAIVEKNHGRLEITSTPGVGSTFTVHLSADKGN